MSIPIRYYASIYKNERNKLVTSVNALTAPSSAVMGVIHEKPANAHRISRLTIVHPGGHALACISPVAFVKCEILLAHPKKHSEKNESFVEQGGHHMGLRIVIAGVAA